MCILVKIGKADWSKLTRLLLLHSQIEKRNEDLIACSHVSSNHLKRKAAYTAVLYMIYGYKRRTCNIGLVITNY